MILLVSNSRDFAVEPVISRLRSQGQAFIRLDLDLLRHDAVVLDPLAPALRYQLSGGAVQEVTSPSAILYRAPTHLRESGGHRYSPEDLLARHQWAAFARSLMVFRDAAWINHPANTFAAENKPLQLATAASVGFSVPRTRVANILPAEFGAQEVVAVKALDSFLVRKEDEDLFFYTACMKRAELTPEACRDMPMIIQDYCEMKLDVRITVVGDTCFVAETSNSIAGDWRLEHRRAEFKPAEAPEQLLQQCRALLRAFGLTYGAIDLVRQGQVYQFLEVNPTGEWVWLDELFGERISDSIATLLVGGRPNAPT